MEIELLPAVPPEYVPVLTDDERTVVKAVLDDDSRLDVAIPLDMPAERLWAGLCGSAKIQQGAASASDKIKPILGRFLIVLQDYPEIYQSEGYRTYEDFMRKGLKEKFGISRTEAYACRKVAEKFPSLTPTEFKQIGVGKLYALASLTHDGDRNSTLLIEKAKDPETSKRQLEEYAAELTHRNSNEIRLTDVRITVTRETSEYWKAMVKSPEIQAYCSAATGEPASEGTIFRSALEEAVTEWTTQGRALIDGQWRIR